MTQTLVRDRDSNRDRDSLSIVRYSISITEFEDKFHFCLKGGKSIYIFIAYLCRDPLDKLDCLESKDHVVNPVTLVKLVKEEQK